MELTSGLQENAMSLGPKGSDTHRAALTSDTGDLIQDTSRKKQGEKQIIFSSIDKTRQSNCLFFFLFNPKASAIKLVLYAFKPFQQHVPINYKPFKYSSSSQISMKGINKPCHKFNQARLYTHLVSVITCLGNCIQKCLWPQPQTSKF